MRGDREIEREMREKFLETVHREKEFDILEFFFFKYNDHHVALEEGGLGFNSI